MKTCKYYCILIVIVLFFCSCENKESSKDIKDESNTTKIMSDGKIVNSNNQIVKSDNFHLELVASETNLKKGDNVKFIAKLHNKTNRRYNTIATTQLLYIYILPKNEIDSFSVTSMFYKEYIISENQIIEESIDSENLKRGEYILRALALFEDVDANEEYYLKSEDIPVIVE